MTGQIDQAYQTVTVSGTGAAKNTSLAHSSGNSFLTFSGNEDLGSGLKASFKIEADVAQNSAAFGMNNREAWVGLNGAFGDIKVGTQYANVFNVLAAVDPQGANNITGWGPLSTGAEGTAAYIVTKGLLANNDVVTYTLPSLVSGLNLSAQSIRSQNGTSTTTGSSLGASYAVGGLFLAMATQTTGADRTTATSGSYDLGVVKFGLSSLDATFSGTNDKDNTYYVSAPVGEAVHLGFSSGTNKSGTASVKNSQFSAYYNLSKRTSLFGLYGSTSAAATSTTTTAFGVNHAF